MHETKIPPSTCNTNHPSAGLMNIRLHESPVRIAPPMEVFNFLASRIQSALGDSPTYIILIHPKAPSTAPSPFWGSTTQPHLCHSDPFCALQISLWMTSMRRLEPQGAKAWKSELKLSALHSLEPSHASQSPICLPCLLGFAPEAQVRAQRNFAIFCICLLPNFITYGVFRK